MTKELPPSAFKDTMPMSSVFQNSEREIVARNIVQILADNGDTWRELPLAEYEKRRKKDGNYSSEEKDIFKAIVGDITSFVDAVALSPSWARIARKK